jgi:hypothetical protein
MGRAVGIALVAMLAVPQALALTLIPPGVSTCSTTSLGGSTACEGVYSGNDANQDLGGVFGQTGWNQIEKVDSSSGNSNDNGLNLMVSANAGGTSGKWQVDDYQGNNPVMFVLKGGNSFSAFLMNLNVTSGTWNTDSLLKGNGKPGPGLSHFTVYSAGVTPVPVPAAVWLMGSGLLALVGIGRRKLKS